MPEDSGNKLTMVSCSACEYRCHQILSKRPRQWCAADRSSRIVSGSTAKRRTTQPRLQSCLMEIWRLTRKRHSNGEADVDASGLSHKVHTCSINNFPTAARLASAAGYACQVYTLSRVMGVEGELSVVSRQGSGSACRSMYVGFVQWIMGQQEDGKDSLTQQVEPETHWPELRVLVLVVSAEWKPVGSTSGMQTSVETSSLLKHRADAVVPARMKEMIEAVHKRNFTVFAELTMKDSNQFHATCLDTYPPIFYLNDVSHRIINLVHRYNHHYRETKAGPGPCVVEDPSEHLLGSDGLPKKGA